jgi:hypothetical protein
MRRGYFRRSLMATRPTAWRPRILLAFTVALLGLAPVAATSTMAGASGAGTIYYIDNGTNKDGITCSDTYPGTSATQPWCDWGNFDSFGTNPPVATLQPGDTISLADNDNWEICDLLDPEIDCGTYPPPPGTAAPTPPLDLATTANGITVDSYQPSYPLGTTPPATKAPVLRGEVGDCTNDGTSPATSQPCSVTNVISVCDNPSIVCNNPSAWTITGITFKNLDKPPVVFRYTMPNQTSSNLIFTYDTFDNLAANPDTFVAGTSPYSSAIDLDASAINQENTPLNAPLGENITFSHLTILNADPPGLGSPDDFIFTATGSTAQTIKYPWHNSNDTWQDVYYDDNVVNGFDGAGVVDTTGLTVTGNSFSNCDAAFLTYGATCFFLFDDEDATFSNNYFDISHNTVNSSGTTNTTDETFVDQEAYNDGTTFNGNFFTQAAGAPLEILFLCGDGSDGGTQHDCGYKGGGQPKAPCVGAGDCNNTESNMSVAANGFCDDNTAIGKTNTSGDLFYGNAGEPLSAGNTFSSTSNTSGNLYDEPSFASSGNSYYQPANKFSEAGFSPTGGTSVSKDDLSNAADQFPDGGGASCPGSPGDWTYEIVGSSGTTPLSSCSSTTRECTCPSSSCGDVQASAFVSQLDQMPDTDSSDWVTRAWTAPASGGTIDIAGQILPDVAGGTCGSGVDAQITETVDGGTPSVIWPTNSTTTPPPPYDLSCTDTAGTNTDVSGLAVPPNAVISFQVNDGGSGTNTGDLTSWNPSIAFFPSSG